MSTFKHPQLIVLLYGEKYAHKDGSFKPVSDGQRSLAVAISRQFGLKPGSCEATLSLMSSPSARSQYSSSPIALALLNFVENRLTKESYLLFKKHFQEALEFRVSGAKATRKQGYPKGTFEALNTVLLHVRNASTLASRETTRLVFLIDEAEVSVSIKKAPQSRQKKSAP